MFHSRYSVLFSLGLTLGSFPCFTVRQIQGQEASSVVVKSVDVESAKKRIDALGSVAKITLNANKITEIVISDGSNLTPEDIALFGRLSDLQKLHIMNCRMLNSDHVKLLGGLKNLTSLALTNNVIDDSAVEFIVKSFPNLVELDLSLNANMSNQILGPISDLTKLQRLTLIQTRLNELSTRRLAKLKELQVLDLRGNMEAGNMTLEILAELPKLKAFKHRSTAITDNGIENLSKSANLENLLIQDFAISSQSGNYLSNLKKLTQLEVFRCQGFGSDGVLALKGLPLQRLTLRDLPAVDDQALEVLTDLPKLKRLYLHELTVTDAGLKNLASCTSLELLDIWSVPALSDATVDVIAKLPNLKELTIRTTDVTDACVDKILAMPKLQSLVFKENGKISEAAVAKLKTKKWTKLDVGGGPSSASE